MTEQSPAQAHAMPRRRKHLRAALAGSHAALDVARSELRDARSLARQAQAERDTARRELEQAHDAYRKVIGERAAAEDEAGTLRERIELARQALIEDGYFTADQVGDDIAPRIIERLNEFDEAHRQRLSDVQAEHARRVAAWDRDRKRLEAERDSSRAEYRDAAAERDRLREQLDKPLSATFSTAVTDPPPLPRDLSGDLDAIPPHAVAEPAPAAAPAAKKATTRKPAAKPAGENS